MRILMIREAIGYTVPTLNFGQGIVAMILHNAGFEVKVLDNNSSYKLYKTINYFKIVRSFKPDFIACGMTWIFHKVKSIRYYFATLLFGDKA